MREKVYIPLCHAFGQSITLKLIFQSKKNLKMKKTIFVAAFLLLSLCGYSKNSIPNQSLVPQIGLDETKELPYSISSVEGVKCTVTATFQHNGVTYTVSETSSICGVAAILVNAAIKQIREE